jgi:RNA polymerase sigma factor (sigma-70 family)
MTTTYAPDVTDNFTRQFVCRVARELVADGVFGKDDLEDVMQDLFTHLIERLPKFDPDKARWSTFVKTVVCRFSISLRRRRQAECRGRSIPHHSLAQTIQGPDGERIELAGNVTEEAYDGAYGRDFRSNEACFVLESDVNAVIALLSPADQDLCRRLTEKPLAHVASDLGVSRATLSDRVRRLREAFRAAGFDGAH